jgi:hypothetical protein
MNELAANQLFEAMKRQESMPEWDGKYVVNDTQWRIFPRDQRAVYAPVLFRGAACA